MEATFEKRADNDESACFRWTVKFFALDGKTDRGLNALGCGRSEYDNACFGVFRAPSGSIALQRSVSAVCLTVSVPCDGQNPDSTNG